MRTYPDAVRVRLGVRVVASLLAHRKRRASDDALGDDHCIDRVGTTLINLAQINQDRARPDVALTQLKEALQIERDVGNQQLLALCLNSIDSVYFAKGQVEDAATYFERALAGKPRCSSAGSGRHRTSARVSLDDGLMPHTFFDRTLTK